jgi:hypothetical protein
MCLSTGLRKEQFSTYLIGYLMGPYHRTPIDAS